MLKITNKQIDTIENCHSKKVTHCASVYILINFIAFFRFSFVLSFKATLFSSWLHVDDYAVYVHSMIIFFGMIYLKSNKIIQSEWKKRQFTLWICMRVGVYISSLSYRLNILQIRNFNGRRTNHRKRFVWQAHRHTHTHITVWFVYFVCDFVVSHIVEIFCPKNQWNSSRRRWRRKNKIYIFYTTIPEFPSVN